MNLRAYGITKTTIYAIANIIAGLLLYLGSDTSIKEYFPDASASFLFWNGVIVGVLRMVTNKAIFAVIMTAMILGASVGHCAPVTISEPTNVEAGELTILEVETTAPRITVVGVPNDGKWSYFKIEKKIILVPRATAYTFVVSAADDKTLDTVVRTVKVGGSPSPDPNVPESDLQIKVGNWAATLEGTTAVGRSFTENANLPYSTLEDLIERTLASNQKLNIDKPAWSTSFFIPLQGYLESVYNANPQTDFIPIWREIGAKLQALGR